MPELFSPPRRLAFRGRIEASAFAFSRALFSGATLRGRVLSLWQSGARLEEFDWGHVLRLPRPVRVRADEAPALPLVRQGNRLASAPFAAQDAPGEGVWIIEGGAWRELKNGREVDVSHWIDAGDWSVVRAQSLGEVARVPLAVAPLALDLRRATGVGAPEGEWKTEWERGGRSSLLRDVAPGFWMAQWSRMLTPARDANGTIIASDFKIVMSGALVLGGALLFLVSALLSPAHATGGAVAALLLIALLSAVAWGWRRSLPEAFAQRRIAFLSVSNRVRNVALALFALGMLRIVFYSRDVANTTCWILFAAWFIASRTALVGRLVGQQAVGVNGAPTSPASRTAAGAKGENWLTRWLRSRSQKASGGVSGTGAAANWLLRKMNKNGVPGAPSADPLGDAWRRLLAQMAWQSGLFKTLGRAQARYLLRSMEMFERGDLEAALRHAIALGGKGEGRMPPPALGVPNARDELSIAPWQGLARGSFDFGPDVEAKLRTMYRRAFEKLRDAGDFDKAAFVLAELLQASEEAVAFLEQHDKLELAAQIAEARDLPPGLVVRQWWIAGNRERAVALAQLKGAFADAITRLERDPKRRDEALALRLLWGHHLAGSGRFGAAVDAVRSVPQGIAFARKWIRLGLEEHPSPQLLVQALVLEPQSWSEWQPLLLRLWNEDRSPGGARDRARFVRELSRSNSAPPEAKPVLAVAARASMRALLRDLTQGGDALDKADFERLQTLSNDGILRADVRLPSPVKRSAPSVPVEVRFEGGEGTLVARDAAVLESGELLVALGEAGAQLRSRDGRVKAHFDVPAHKIVRPFDGSRVLLLAPRDDSWRVSKLDVRERRAQFWGDLRLDCFCDEFDGALWFAASEGRVRALDVSGEVPRALWDSGELNGRAVDVAMSRNSLAVLVSRLGKEGLVFESWRFELPSLVLRARTTTELEGFPLEQPSFILRRQVFADGEQFAVGLKAIAGDEQKLVWFTPKVQHIVDPLPLGVLEARPVFSPFAALSICWKNNEGAVATLVSRSASRVEARLFFPGASQISSRECNSQWLVWDDLGRVALFNPQTGRVEREWKLN